LASGFQVNADNWHSASSDTIILKEVLFKMISFLEKNKWVDIKDAQRDSINKTLKIRKRNHKR
jgi:DNA polymerase III alpha subunit (gram-positive type)